MKQKQGVNSKSPFHIHNMKRWFKYKYLLLTRAKGGPGIVALGFSIGLAVEMFTLPTAGLAFFLIFPLVYMLRANMAAALIGFVFGKIIYLPLTYVHLKVGGLVIPRGTGRQLLAFLPDWIDMFIKSNLKLFVGGVIDGILLGLLFYFPIKWGLEYFEERRREKRRQRKERLVISTESTP